MLCTEFVSDIQNNFCTYTTCSPHVLQKEELMTKIYQYSTEINEMKEGKKLKLRMQIQGAFELTVVNSFVKNVCDVTA